MKTYGLYLESGPRKKKTMVHVLDLLGCIATGPTSDAALANTHNAIRAYLRFLKQHGDGEQRRLDLRAKFDTEIIEHVMQGKWLGNGDPTLVFKPDQKPLTPEDRLTYIGRLGAMHAEGLDLIGSLSDKELDAEPGYKMRSINAIVEHMLESSHYYLSTLGKIEGLPSAGHIVERREDELLLWMTRVHRILIERIQALSPEELSHSIVHWKETWTARKTLRRMLEHEWEHLVELKERIRQSK